MTHGTSRLLSSLRRARRMFGPRRAPATTAQGRRARPHAVGDARRLLRMHDVRAAQTLADEELSRRTPTPEGLVAAALVAHRRRLHARALRLFDRAAEASLALAPDEFVDALFRVDPHRGLEAVRTWLEASPQPVGPRTWHTILRHVFAHGDDALRRAVHDRFAQAVGAPGADWPDGAQEVAWLERWHDAVRHASAPRHPQRVPFAVMDYVQPGRAKSSQNLGDHIQTLASLAHVVRRQGLRFHGDAALVGITEELRSRVRPDLRLPGRPADVELYRVDRDASSFQAFPPDTWVLGFGWYSHDLAGAGVWDFPLHENLRPIFVSFHCSKRALLTPEALDHLRAHGPVGCRDWTTVDLLLSLGVPAFFSGCLTTTVSTLFPDPGARPADATVYVDAVRDPAPDGQPNTKQSYPQVRARSLAANLRAAVDLLEWYRSSFTRVVTRRLHCYLPARSLGLDVDFRPTTYADVRFAGLYPLDDAAYDAMRTAMLARLEPVLTAIFDGQEPEDVYAVWRRTVAPEVAAARARHAAARPLPSLPATATAIAEPLRVVEPEPAVPDRAAPPVDVVLLPTRRELAHVGQAVRALDAAATAPQRVWLVGARVRGVRLPHLSGLTRVHAVPTGGLDLDGLGLLPRQRAHHVLLPHLLPDVDRAVVVPVDAVVLGDVTELAATDLGGRALAARRTSQSDPSGFGVLYRAAGRLDDLPERATDLYRRLAARHAFDFDAFDTGVLVLDLTRLREVGFADEALIAMRHFRLDAREALHLWAGPRRADLDPRWAYVPTRDLPDAAPLLVHWADPVKPWDEAYVAGQELWEERAAHPVDAVTSARGAGASASRG